MEEDIGEDHGGPLFYPNIHLGETLSHTLVNDVASPWMVFWQRRQNRTSVYSGTDSPHPDGYTYGWLHCNEDYLYAAVEVTADNTCDEEDWEHYLLKSTESSRNSALLLKIQVGAPQDLNIPRQCLTNIEYTNLRFR